MNRLNKKFVFASLALILTAGALWFFIGSNLVHAQGLDTGINYVNGTGLSNQDPRVAIANIIRIILGFLGVLALGLIMYAGFIWMTAKGEEEKIENAKKIMIGAVIGLVIVLASFGIASYIISRLSGATGGGSGSGSCSPACSSGQYCCNNSCQATPCNNIGGGNNAFLVTGTTPAHQAVSVPRNAVIRFRFNSGVRQPSVTNSNFTIVSGGTGIDGVRSASGNYVEFVPTAACDTPNETLKCFPKNATISAEVKSGSSGIISVDGKELVCGGTSRCLLDFTTGEIVDTDAPKVNITSQQVCAASDNTLKASSTDNYGVSKIDFYVADNLIGSSINNSNPFVGSPYNAETPWNSNGFTVGQSVKLKATAFDLDTNSATAEKTIKLSAAHCCNGTQDEDETGKDCGGKDCLSCTGQACAADIGQPKQCSDTLCQSGFCNASGTTAEDCTNAGYPIGTTSCCVCKSRPVIDWVSPAGGFCSNKPDTPCRQSTEAKDCGTNAACDLGTPNGNAGNFITIAGSGFGTTRGKVFIAGVQVKLADDVGEGNPACNTSAWRDNQIIAIVPAGSNNGVISIETSTGAKDTTDDAYGALINDFKTNTIDRPGVCALTPAKGKINDSVQYAGIKLTASEAYYGNLSNNVKALVSNFTAPKQGTATVPNINSGATTTFVLKDSIESNFLPFTKDNEPYEGPVIVSVEPITGPVGQYVTVRGSGFGSSRSTSKVFFGTSSSGVEADYAFPDICAQSIWSDNQVVIKVPKGVAVNSDYKITLQRSGFADADSNDQNFSTVAGTPNPGVCRLQPSLGQTNSPVMLWGEYFGNKDVNSAIRFYNNVSQQGGAVTFWNIDETASGIKPWKVITTVPKDAQTGPVVLLNSKISNALNFIVGSCTKDADCGSEIGTTCCAAGLPEAGKCKVKPNECYGSVATSVYEWSFSTGNQSACAADQQRCGTVCCSGACDPKVPNKCLKCLSGMNECGDGNCCNMGCQGNPSHCPDPVSCSGYSYNQCLEGYYCPNSPGLCSPYPGTGNPIETGDCSDDACLAKAGCKNKTGGNICHYDAALNRCVQNNTDSCKKTELVDSLGRTIKVNNQPVTGQCGPYSGSNHWYINHTQSCPTGWVRSTSNICVDNTDINGKCTKCASPFSCQLSGKLGTCAINETICSSGSTCNSTNKKCEKKDTGKCDCCCRKTNSNEDCCSDLTGLTCEGSCGSQDKNLGVCTGCVVNGVPDDGICNVCATGKYCDAAASPRGVCNDCSSITDPTECSKHEQCCVDGKNNNKCTSVVKNGTRFQEVGGPVGGGLFFCAYYNCANTYPNTCKGVAEKVGVYNVLNTCNQSCATEPIKCGRGGNNEQCTDDYCPGVLRCDIKTCECKTNDPGPGEPCKDPLGNCHGTCTSGYQCMLPTAYNAGNGIDASGSQDTCRCCCKPTVNPGDKDSCKAINDNLSCLPDKEPCTSPARERGLCCGCSRDDQCGDVATTGCSTVDRCCRTRPTVESRTPEVNSTNVCRNTVIEAVFDQKMDMTSFSDNVFLIGDYNKLCSDYGYSTVARAQQSTTGLASIVHSFKGLLVKVFPSLLTKSAFADFGHLCYVTGSVVASDTISNKSKVSFRLTKALDQNINYYLVLKGDPDLASNEQNKDFYNANIGSAYKIGMTGAVKRPAVNQFNTTIFDNAEIWTFSTGEDVCKLEKVGVNPAFQLFQRSGQEAILEAEALDKNNSPIQPIATFYAWDWNWVSDNKDVATVQQGGIGEEYKATAKAGSKQDAQTLARAKATITIDTANKPSTKGQSREGTALLRVFLCENPWPVFYSDPPFPPGYSWPWKDAASGIEFYYCRDKSGVGTIDDLPALTNPPITRDAARKICMFGGNAGRTCSSDVNCNNLSGSCLPEVLKEFFFFRETEPGIPEINGSADPLGQKVTLSWDPTPNSANGYKVYYGLSSGQYVYTVNVPAGNTKITRTIDGLVNGLNYYFAVTALSDKNQESIFSNEKVLKPADTTPPAAPKLNATGGDKKISLSWDAVPEATRYIAYLGLISKDYSTSTQTITTKATFNGLNNGTTYYVSVKAVDQYGNFSAPSDEKSVLVTPAGSIGN
ncbi:MAG: IPT/TIG domain-containing protein [Candidatus Falkowbacteria bacterium]|nr:IPT/TIG domain-containing protein [Candidatus Falkowbacteria bacterium]